MTFVEAIKSVFTNYAKFDGRSRRSEYWYFFLFNFIVGIVLNVIAKAIGLGILPTLYSLATVIPGLAVAIRRMHDTGKSGWLLLLALVPVVGAIIVIIMLCKDSEPGENMYGSNPKETF